MASSLSEAVPKFTAEALRSAAKFSEGCHVVPVRLRRAIKKYLREEEDPHMNRKVLSLSKSLSQIKEVNLTLPISTSKELVEDPLKSTESSKRWKITSAYGDIGLTYRDDESIAYVASRMPAVFSACYRVLTEVRRRVPDFSPVKVLDFGAGTGAAMWALREVWPQSVEKINLIEPSQSMQRAGLRLIQDQKNLPFIQSYGSLQALTQKINKSERKHDLVIASYVLGEIPSLKDRITIVRQLWDLTGDVLVILEPGTPEGSNIISHIRSHILWMENRKFRKAEAAAHKGSTSLVTAKSGAFIVAPCPHDGRCPLNKTGKYCHFIQRLQRTTSQRAYKRSKGKPLRGYEDEKFCYVAFRRGQRPRQVLYLVTFQLKPHVFGLTCTILREPWPLDDMKFDTLKEQKAKRSPEDLETDYDDQSVSDTDEDEQEKNLVSHNPEFTETEAISDSDANAEVQEEEKPAADLGSGWGRIIYSPIRRGKRVELDVCRSTNRDGSEGSFDRIIITQSKNPTLHLQARRSLWGDLWPF
ncbi:OLC1v1028863C1 [Oldenlandia corymbosa var. corymbosa]|uniref:OLC1v1028863C1 n=1 Tax=Oldenlandia corymbosa var. corymbosa TaxID=529605 RepID=A0AAV1CFE5_OLDCO|nr:OLC1v1028863C1 [Oldenlandia corymbosa var. corymbosa]